MGFWVLIEIHAILWFFSKILVHFNLQFVFIFCLQGETTTEILVVVMDIQVVCLDRMVDVGVDEAHTIIIEGIMSGQILVMMAAPDGIHLPRMGTMD